MSREEHARAGAQKVIGNEEVLDVALVNPRGSTRAAMIGAAVGSGIGQATGGQVASWGMGGALGGERVFAKNKGVTPTFVLATTPQHLYVLGRNSTATWGRWKKMTLVNHIPREHLELKHRMKGAVRQIDLIDTRSGATLQFEARALGTLGVKALLKSLESQG